MKYTNGPIEKRPSGGFSARIRADNGSEFAATGPNGNFVFDTKQGAEEARTWYRKKNKI